MRPGSERSVVLATRINSDTDSLLSINILSVANTVNHDFTCDIIDLITNPIVAAPLSIQVIGALKLLRASTTRIFQYLFNPVLEPLHDLAGETIEIALGMW